MGIGPGDEVIVPDTTWIASAAPITYVGATPVFADIDRQTWCLSTDTLAAAITPRTKAVIVVDLYGNMPDLPALLDVTSHHGLCVIEDAAEAAGAEYAGRKSGSFGDTGVFSFHGSKTLTTGEGGMLVTNDEALHRRVLFLRDHGRRPGDKQFWNTEVGYKYKMSSMQEGIEEITLNHELRAAKNGYWMVTIVLDRNYGVEKETLQQQLSDKDIDCRPFFHPLSSIPAFGHLPQAETARANNRVAYEIAPYGINLPSGLNLTRDQIQYVCDTLKGLLKQ